MEKPYLMKMNQLGFCAAMLALASTGSLVGGESSAANCSCEGTSQCDTSCSDSASTTSTTTAASSVLTEMATTSGAASFSTEEVATISEAFGHLIGRSLNSPGFNFNLDSIIKGLRDSAAGKESPMTEEEYDEVISLIQENAFHQLAETNLLEAETFLKTNALLEDVSEVTPGKLQFTVMKQGEGDTVGAHGSPLIHYTGKYLDGTVFGSSVETGTPITLDLDGTIPGFSSGLVGMKSGEKRRLFIHPDMGYGTSGHLPPNSLLVFDVEVIEANPGSTTGISLDSSEKISEEITESSIAETTDTEATTSVQ